jgi:hypothetical protein
MAGMGDLEGPARWEWSDAWVLTAIMAVDKEAGSTLTEIVAAADMINHAIVLESEIEPAVRKLSGAGLIRVRQGRFFLTEPGREMTAAGRGGFLQQADLAWQKLRGLPVSEHEWRLRPGELDEAVQAWSRRADELTAGRQRRTGNEPPAPAT